MNTRLQVEHPVTEFVTGRDLVADQIRIAGGEPLGFDQRDVRRDGHAVEVRLYAEDAEHGFLPATGEVHRLRWPTGEGIRVDAGVMDGDEVGGRFDPMLAKVIAHGSDRDDALERLTSGPRRHASILGLTTNLRFLRWLVREPVVREGAARTDTLDRIWPPDDWAAPDADPGRGMVGRDAALLLAGRTSGDGFRLNAAPTARLTAEEEITDASASYRAARRCARRASSSDDTVHLDLAGRSVAFRLAPPPDVDRAASAAAAAHGIGPGRAGRADAGPGPLDRRPVGAAVEAGDDRRDPRGDEDGARRDGSARRASSATSSCAPATRSRAASRSLSSSPPESRRGTLRPWRPTTRDDPLPAAPRSCRRPGPSSWPSTARPARVGTLRHTAARSTSRRST